MRSIRNVLLSVGLGALLAASAGCGGDPLKKMDEFAEKMCKCEDAACVKTVNSEMMEWMKANADRAKEPSEADKAKVGEIMKRMVTCSKEATAGKASGAKNEEAAAQQEAGGGE